MNETLSPTQASPSPEFFLTGGGAQGAIDNYQVAVCSVHTGGTWVLEYQAPDGNWVAYDVTFTGKGSQPFYVPYVGGWFRWVGGSTGARIYCSGVRD